MPNNKTLTSAKVYRKLVDIIQPAEDAIYMQNRNPRNLEMMKIAYRPNGYFLEKRGKCFWHKLIVNKSNKSVTAQLKHYTGRIVLQASTEDWSLAKQLYKPADTAAYINLGRVFAQRCLEAGIIEMEKDFEAPPNGKLDKFLKEVESGGVSLTESNRYRKELLSGPIRMDKPWAIHVD